MAWGAYKNGNSFTRINLNDGTKIRETKDDYFDLEFPESLDISCTSKCNGGCKYCYANCTPNGIHADLLNAKFINTLHPYTEVALQLNDLTHPQMIEFLKKLKNKHVIANMTVNQIHFEKEQSRIASLVENKLIKGIGVSLQKPTSDFISMVKKYPNAVIHTINGILSADDIETLRDNDLKILILGYKELGRGVEYLNENSINIRNRQKYLYDVLPTLPDHFKAVSFDNLAIEQLNVRRLFTPEEWDEFYMGDEGSSSMFVDMVKGKFGVSSLCSENEMFPIKDDIKDMFAVIKGLRT